MDCQPNVCTFVVQRSPASDATQNAVDRQNRLDRVRPDTAALYRWIKTRYSIHASNSLATSYEHIRQRVMIDPVFLPESIANWLEPFSWTIPSYTAPDGRDRSGISQHPTDNGLSSSFRKTSLEHSCADGQGFIQAPFRGKLPPKLRKFPSNVAPDLLTMGLCP